MDFDPAQVAGWLTLGVVMSGILWKLVGGAKGFLADQAEKNQAAVLERLDHSDANDKALLEELATVTKTQARHGENIVSIDRRVAHLEGRNGLALGALHEESPE